jgi:hypothetical protein
VPAPSEEKSDDSKDSFYEVLEQVYNHFPAYHMKILSFNAKLRRQDIFKPTSRNSNDNGATVVNLATSNNLVVKSKIFLQQNIQK